MVPLSLGSVSYIDYFSGNFTQFRSVFDRFSGEIRSIPQVSTNETFNGIDRIRLRCENEKE